jgi:hypothetical protein
VCFCEFLTVFLSLFFSPSLLSLSLDFLKRATALHRDHRDDVTVSSMKRSLDIKKRAIASSRSCGEDLGDRVNEGGLDIAQDGQLWDDSGTGEYYERETASKFQAVREAADLFDSRESLFGVPPTQWRVQLTELQKQFEPHQRLWTIAFEFINQHPSWDEGVFFGHDADDVDAAGNGRPKQLA